jgi:hypothetical protein
MIFVGDNSMEVVNGGGDINISAVQQYKMEDGEMQRSIKQVNYWVNESENQQL